jgi:hypothetical protein
MKTKRDGDNLASTSETRMSNSGYHRDGKPTWWVRLGEGDAARHVGERAYLRPAIDVNRKRLQKLFGEIFRGEAGRG